MRVIRVAVADDDAVFRDALVDVVRADARFELVGTAGTTVEILELVERLAPDLVLLDVRMPGGGPEAARAISGIGGNTIHVGAPVVVAVSGQSGPSVVLSMLRAGAVGYIAKGQVGDELGDLLVRCAAGEVILAVPGAPDALRRLIAD